MGEMESEISICIKSFATIQGAADVTPSYEEGRRVNKF